MSTFREAAARGDVATMRSCVDSAMQLAAQCGHVDATRYLVVALGADPSACDNKAIIAAAERGHIEVVRFLASQPHVDAAAEDNLAIQLAAEYGHVAVVRHLASLPGVDPAANMNDAIQMAAKHDFTLDGLSIADSQMLVSNAGTDYSVIPLLPEDLATAATAAAAMLEAGEELRAVTTVVAKRFDVVLPTDADADADAVVNDEAAGTR